MTDGRKITQSCFSNYIVAPILIYVYNFFVKSLCKKGCRITNPTLSFHVSCAGVLVDRIPTGKKHLSIALVRSVDEMTSMVANMTI